MAVLIETAPRIMLTQSEAAEALGISERTLWGLTQPRGPIPAVRLGRSVRYSVESLREWVKSQEAATVA